MLSKKNRGRAIRLNRFFGAFSVTFLLVMTLMIPIVTRQDISVKAADSGWWVDTAWDYSKKITINSSLVDATLAYFPVLVNITSDSDLATNAQADGNDTLFTLSGDNETKLNHEIEYWNDDGTYVNASIWVNVTSLSSSADTVMYMYYGNASAANQENMEGTWNSGYVAVYHMNDSTTSAITDSTGNYGGTKASANNPIESSALIAEGQDFSSDYISLGSSFMGGATVGTYEAWFNYDTLTTPFGNANTRNTILGRAGAVDDSGFGINEDTLQLIAYHSGSELLSSTTVANGVWYHVATTWNTTDRDLFVNGTVDASDGGNCEWDGGGAFHTYIGMCYTSLGNGYQDGHIDEVRASNVKRSDEWINASYHSQNQTTGFLTIGSEQTESVPAEETKPEYLIITNSTLYSGFDNFTSWKDWQGYNMTIVNYTDFTSNNSFWYNGYWGDASNATNPWMSGVANVTNTTLFNDSAAIIRNYIRYQVTNNSMGYVLIGGDPDYVPVRFGYDVEDWGNPDSFIDSYFSCLNGTLNPDEEVEWGYLPKGEIYDYEYDIVFGRLPLRKVSEIENYTAKAEIYYNASADWLFNTTVVSGASNTVNFYQFLDTNNYFDEVYTNLEMVYADESYSDKDDTNQLVNATNNGTHFWLYEGHSSILGMENIFFGGDAYRLNNQNYPFVAILGGCDQATLNTSMYNEISYNILRNITGAVIFISTNYDAVTHYKPYDSIINHFIQNGTTYAESMQNAIEDFGWNSNNSHLRGKHSAWLNLKFYGDPSLSFNTNRPNSQPGIVDESPADSAVNIYGNSTLSVKVASLEGDTMDVYFYTNATGTWGQIGSTNSSVGNGTYSQTNESMYVDNTKYWWSVNVTETVSGEWTNETYSFTVYSDKAPTITMLSPLVDGENKNYSVRNINKIEVNITDEDLYTGDYETIFWSIETSPYIGKSTGWFIEENGTKYCTVSHRDIDFSQIYTIYVNVSSFNRTSSSYGLWNNQTYEIQFLLYTETIPIFSAYPSVINPSPSNESVGQILNPNLYIDLDSNFTRDSNITFRTNATGSWGDIGSNDTSDGPYQYLTLRPNSNFTTPEGLWYYNEYAPDDIWEIEPSDDVWNVTSDQSNDSYMNSSSSVPTYRFFGLENHTTETGIINDVTLYAIGKDGSEAGLTVQIMPRWLPDYAAGLSLAFDNDILHTKSGTWTANPKTYQFNPLLGSKWTWTEVDDLDVGGSFDKYANLTEIWVVVNYTENTGTHTWTNSSMDTYDTKYWWSVNATDGELWTNKTYSFTTGSAGAPALSSESPVNESSGVELTPTLSITVNDMDTINVTFRTNATGIWTTIENYTNQSAGTFTSTNTSSMDTNETTYWWSVNTTDGTDWTNKTYHFTTQLGSSSYNYYKKITINSSLVDENLVNFPILITWASDADLVSHAQADGDDIAFAKSDNSSFYNHEIENYNSSTGKLVAWVNITSLSSSVDTVIWMSYGDAESGSQEDIEGTWNSGYAAVWHYNETTGDYIDSTVNNNDCPSATVDVVTRTATGIVGSCPEFDGSADEILVPDDDSLDISTYITLESWVKMDDTDDWRTIFSSLGQGTKKEIYWGVYQQKMFIALAGPKDLEWTTNTASPENIWQYQVFNYDGSYINCYYNGTYQEQLAGSGSLDLGSSTSEKYMGYNTKWKTERHDGLMDEMRISNVARNASWINATYHTIADGSFITVGSEQTPGISWQTISSDINGSYYNETTFTSFSTDINGSYSNSTSFTAFSSDINGSYINTTGWAGFSSDINGSYSNTTAFTSFSSDINGSYTNTSINTAPTITNPIPANESTGISLNPTMNITINDVDGNSMNITWYSNVSGTWQIYGTNTSIGNGTYHQTDTNFSEYNWTYYWNVSVNDGTNTNDSDIFQFNTTANPYSILGSQVKGTILYTTNDIVIGNKYTLSEPAKLYSITTYVKYGAGGKIKYGIYDFDDKTFISGSKTEEWGAVTNGYDAPKTLYFDDPVYLDAGDYCLVHWREEADGIYKDNSGSDTYYDAQGYSTNFPSPWTQTSTTPRNYPLWASYTPQSAPEFDNSTASPANGSTGQALDSTLSIMVNDTDADTMNITFFANVSLDYTSSTPVVVNTTYNGYATRMNQQHQVFYAQGLFWSFYNDNEGMAYKTSDDDGTTWSIATRVMNVSSTVYNHSAGFDTWTNETDIHVVWCYGDSTDYSRNETYRKGTLVNDGTISWAEPEVNFLDTMVYNYTFDPNICVDANGYPWIGFKNSSDNKPRITTSSTKDGTWTTPAGFPYQLKNIGEYLPIPVALANGSVYVVYVYSYNSGDGGMYGKLWNGTTWGSEETIYTDASGTVNSHYFGGTTVVAIGNEVHVCFMNQDYEFGTEFYEDTIFYINRSTDGTWSTKTTVVNETYNGVFSGTQPAMSKNSNGDLIVFWVDDSDTMNYNILYNGTSEWSYVVPVTTDSDIDVDSLSVAYEERENRIGVIYTDGADPYTCKFFYLNKTASRGWVELGHNLSVTNDTFYCPNTNAFDEYSTLYYWYASANDGEFTNTSEMYHFTTEAAGISWQTVVSSVNGSYENTTSFTIISDTINGSYENTTSFIFISLNINGSYSNTTSFTIISDTINGSYINSTAFTIISSDINGSYENTTSFIFISSNINGSYSNTTSFTIISSNINGTYTNTSIKTWQIIDSSINGTYYNSTSFTTISDSINGSYYNETAFSSFSTDINGSYVNATSFTSFSNDINGSYVNTSIKTWQSINSSINGTYYNSTSFNVIDTDTNGSYFNTTAFRIISSSINGTYSNSTSFTSFSSDINGSYSNTSLADTVTITLIDYMPSNLRTNNTGEAWFLYNITTTSTPINFWSIVWAYSVNHTLTGTRNTSYSLEDHLAKNKLRGINRNVNYTIETKFNDTAGDGSIGGFGEWNTHDGNKNITLVDSGSNWTLVNATEIIAEHLFNTISFVDSEELSIEDKSSQTLEVSKTTFVKIEFNMTDTGWYNDGHYKNTSMFFHLYANQTNAIKPLDIFYANSNYTTGDVATSPYCELVGDIHQDDSYHFSEYNSSYYEIDFIINETGFIGSVDATSNFSIILCSQTPSNKKWYLHFADDNISHTLDGNTHYHDFDNRTIITITDDTGVSWTPNSSTPDVYFNYISLDEEDISEVKLYANDTSGNSAWSSVHTDLIDITNYAPSPANILVPNENTNYTVGDIVPINYHWIGDPNLDTCWVNITLFNWDVTTLQTWIINQSITNNERLANHSNFTYNWDTTGISASNYTIAINITDGSMWNNHSSDIFYIVNWQTIDSSINGSYTNSSTWTEISTDMNGSYFNTTIFTSFSTDINGSYNNGTSFNTISSDINGSYSNTSIKTWQSFSSDVNGSYTNGTTWAGFSTTVNGSYINGTGWNSISTTINGSYYNGTGWSSFSSNINGSYTNTTSFITISDTINGSYTNTSIKTWQSVDSSINGSYYNSTTFTSFSTDINGSYYNTTSFTSFSTNINGSYYNTTSFKVISTDVNGTYVNTSVIPWNVIDNTINGSYVNTSVITWNTINNSINGSYYNDSLFNTISSDINGSYSNTTNQIIITDEFPGDETYIQNLQPTVYFTITNPLGRVMNYTIYIGNSSANTTTVLSSGNNVTNGTYFYNNYYIASNYTSYWWRVYINDSVQEANETFTFTCTRGGGSIVGSGGGSAFALAAGALLFAVLAIVLFFVKRKKKNDNNNGGYYS